MDRLGYLGVDNRAVPVDDERHDHLAFDVLSLGRSGIVEVLGEPFHEGDDTSRKLGKLFHDSKVQRVVVVVDGRRLLRLLL